MTENPNSLAELLQSWAQQVFHAASLASVGVLIGIGQLLLTDEYRDRWPPVRIMIGRALSTGGLGMAAATVLAWMPTLPWIAQVGIAAALASLGTVGLERLFARLVGGGRE